MANNTDNSSVYKDLIGFLQSSRADLRLEATKAVLQVVSDREQVLQLVEHGVLLPLLRIVSDTTDIACSENALQAILYLSSSVEQVTNQCVEELLQAKAVPRLIELVLSTTSNDKQINFGLAVLANLTRTEQGAVELVGTSLPEEAVVDDQKENDTSDLMRIKPNMELLLDRFLHEKLGAGRTAEAYSQVEAHEWDTMELDPYQHFAALLMNATQLASGRRFVLRIPRQSGSGPTPLSVLERLLPQLRDVNPIRRRGISGMVRNCCLEQDAAWWMLNVAKVMTPILYPLAGPEELDLSEKQGMDPDLWLEGPDKTREIDGPTRQHLVDSILLLCASGRKSRETLRVARAYVVLKNADMVEELESVSERINECVQYLRRDEEGTEEGSSDNMVEEMTRHKLKMLPASQVGSQGNADYDEVD